MAGLLRLLDWCEHVIRFWAAAPLLRNGVGVGVGTASQILVPRDQLLLLRRSGHLDQMSLLDAPDMRWQLVSASPAKRNPTGSLAYPWSFADGAERFECLLKSPSSQS